MGGGIPYGMQMHPGFGFPGTLGHDDPSALKNAPVENSSGSEERKPSSGARSEN